MRGNRAAATVVGLDVGGTTIKGALIDPTRPALVLARASLSAPPAGVHAGGAVLDAAAAVVTRLRAAAAGANQPAPAAVGLAVPGIVDEPAGLAVFAAAFGWRDEPVRDLLRDRIGLPVAFGHDVRCAGLAEWRLGAGEQAADVLVVALGTGIGAAVVADGRLLTSTGYAGQLGHVVVDPAGPACGCGQRGCVGVLASARAIARRYRAASGRETVDGSRDVAELVAAGDPVAARVWDAALDDLVTALVTAVTMFGPTRLVLAGGPSQAGSVLSEPVRRKLAGRLTFQRMPEVTTARLGSDAGMLGSGLAAAGLLAV